MSTTRKRRQSNTGSSSLLNFSKYIFTYPVKLMFGMLLINIPIMRHMVTRSQMMPDLDVHNAMEINFSDHNASFSDDFQPVCSIYQNPQSLLEDNILSQLAKEEQNHVKQIYNAFKEINISIPLKNILFSFNSLKKLGATNRYLMIEFENIEYIVRINGQLWPPYQRSYEQNVLPILKFNQIETNVLFNNDHYQISTKLDDRMRLSSILEGKNYTQITRALQLSGIEIAKYQQIAITQPMVESPLEKMVDNANIILRKKFGTNYSTYFGGFEKSCQYLLGHLAYTAHNRIFSHNDLLPSSIFINFATSKVSIVDWEYSALSYWSNDLSMLSYSLTEKQTISLTTYYHEYKNQTLSDAAWLQLQSNRLIHQFLKLAWKVNPENILTFNHEIKDLSKKTSLVEKIQAKKTKALTVHKKSFFKSQNKDKYYDNTPAKSVYSNTVIKIM